MLSDLFINVWLRRSEEESWRGNGMWVLVIQSSESLLELVSEDESPKSTRCWKWEIQIWFPFISKAAPAHWIRTVYRLQVTGELCRRCPLRGTNGCPAAGWPLEDCFYSRFIILTWQLNFTPCGLRIRTFSELKQSFLRNSFDSVSRYFCFCAHFSFSRSRGALKWLSQIWIKSGVLCRAPHLSHSLLIHKKCSVLMKWIMQV